MTYPMDVPSAWLQRLPPPVPVAWFALFRREPLTALDALLWESMYLDHDHPRERDDLLSNWVALIGEAEDFTALLDQALADWINANWGKLRLDTGAPFHARVWSAVLHTIHLCSPHMQKAAQALITYFPQRVDWLGRWSIGPGQDPLGAMLLCLTGYQTTRQLAPLWRRMVHLPDGIPVHHAAIALEGVLQLPPENGQKSGVFRAEFAQALVDFAIALSHRAQRGDLSEKSARTLWLRLKRSALLRMPFETKWKHDIALLLSRKDENEADGWMIGGVARNWLSDAFGLNDEAVGQCLFQVRNKGAIQWNREWPNRAKELGNRRDTGSPEWRAEADKLIGEQIRYARHTGDTHACVRTLRRLSSKIRHQDSPLAEQWARQAVELDPHDPVGYSALAEALRAAGSGRLDEAAQVYAECIERFPDDAVARNGLAAVHREQSRLDDAEALYLDTIECFPDDVVARAGLAETYREQSRLDDAVAQYQDTIARFPDDVVARTGLAEVFRELGRLPEAKLCYEQALKIDPTNAYAREGIKRLGNVTEKKPLPSKQAYIHSPSRSPGLALRQRRMARHRGLDMAALPQWEESALHSDITLAERVFETLAADQPEQARDILQAALNEFPASASLLTAQARLERREAQAAGAALTEDTRQKVLAAPLNLRKRFPDMEPVYWLEHGLAYHALTDGEVRLNALAESFDRIKLIADQQFNPHDPDAVFKQGWAAGVLRLTGTPIDPKTLAQRITELSHQLDVREEEPILRREAAGRWQPVRPDSH